MMTDEDKIRRYGSIENADKFIAQKYLKDTDYVIIKIMEYQMLNKVVDNDYREILKKREEARNFLRNSEVK